MEKETRFNPNRDRVGLILRVFAQEEHQVPVRVQMIQQMLDQILPLKYTGKPLFARVDVWVWADPRYTELRKTEDGYFVEVKSADCGLTSSALRKAISERGDANRVHVVNCTEGDLFCSLLNEACADQLENGCRWSMIASSESRTYLTDENVGAMLESARNGARAVGLAINELTESIKAGRIANTCSLWHNRSLMGVGGFDEVSAKPINDRVAHYVKSINPETGELFDYAVAGVEEVVTIAKLGRNHGPCIGVVVPVGESQSYQPANDPIVLERNRRKMVTKQQRQDSHLYRRDLHPSCVEGAVKREFCNW